MSIRANTHDTSSTSVQAAADAAYHQHRADRHFRFAAWLIANDRPGAAASELAQGDIHRLLVAIAQAGEPIPSYVRDNLPTMIAWPEVAE